MARSILYQILTEPVLPPAQQVETVTESRWHQPLAVPVLRVALSAALIVASGAVAPVFTPVQAETVTVDKWNAPLSTPTLRKPDVSRPSLFFVGSDTASDARWFSPLSEPVRRNTLATSSHPALAFAPASPFAETVTADRWQQPLSEPVRRRGYPAQHQDELFLVGSDTAKDARWFAPLSVPTLREPTVQPDALSWSYLTPATVETVTLDKWLAPFGLPSFPRGLAVSKQPSLSYVGADPFAEAVSIDKWQQPLSVPVRRITFAEQPSYSRSFYFPAQPDITVEKWHAPLSIPTRLRLLLTAEQPSGAFVKADPFTETVSIDRWLQPLSEPVRRRGQPAFEQDELFFVGSDTATDARWLTALAEPVRRKPTVHPAAGIWSGFTPAAAEAVTIDKWFAPPSQPLLPKRGMAGYRQLGFATAVFVPAPSMAGWFTQMARPVLPLKKGLATYEHPATFLVKASPFLESVTADRWFQPLSVPVRRRVSVAYHPASFWGVLTPPTAVIGALDNPEDFVLYTAEIELWFLTDRET